VLEPHMHVLTLTIDSVQSKGLKRKHQGGDVFTLDKNQKLQLEDNQNVSPSLHSSQA
jgi:hypothetical protein